MDLGASWMNEHLQPLICALALESGNKLVKQSVIGKASLELGPGYKVDYQDGKHLSILAWSLEFRAQHPIVGRLDQTEVPLNPLDTESYDKVECLLTALTSDHIASKGGHALDERVNAHDHLTMSAWLDLPEVAATPAVKNAMMTEIHSLFGLELDEMPLSGVIQAAATTGESHEMPSGIGRKKSLTGM